MTEWTPELITLALGSVAAISTAIFAKAKSSGPEKVKMDKQPAIHQQVARPDTQSEMTIANNSEVIASSLVSMVTTLDLMQRDLSKIESRSR